MLTSNSKESNKKTYQASAKEEETTYDLAITIS